MKAVSAEQRHLEGRGREWDCRAEVRRAGLEEAAG